MDTSTEPASPLTPAVFQILLVLAAGEAHGYAIMQEVARITNGTAQLGPGTLYRSVHRMLEDRLIEAASPADEVDERRTTYRLTRHGRTVARGEAERLAQLVSVARACGLLGSAASRSRRGARTQ
jgi:DNA-binding PadR family transcriptional regulator